MVNTSWTYYCCKLWLVKVHILYVSLYLKAPIICRSSNFTCENYDNLHRDLILIFIYFFSLENLLLTADHKTVKLADFGLAREESLTEMMTAETGTYRWMAPEVLH